MIYIYIYAYIHTYVDTHHVYIYIITIGGGDHGPLRRGGARGLPGGRPDALTVNTYVIMINSIIVIIIMMIMIMIIIVRIILRL